MDLQGRGIGVIALWDSRWERGDRPFGYLGKRAIALLSKQKLKQLRPVNAWAAVNSVAKVF
jgi:hypothetical protein